MTMTETELKQAIDQAFTERPRWSRSELNERFSPGVYDDDLDMAVFRYLKATYKLWPGGVGAGRGTNPDSIFLRDDEHQRILMAIHGIEAGR